jgi:hypothetical protein
VVAVEPLEQRRARLLGGGSRRRGDGAAPVWFERLAGPEVTAELDGWLRAGGPGAAAVPGALAERVVERTTPEE